MQVAWERVEQGKKRIRGIEVGILNEVALIMNIRNGELKIVKKNIQ